MTKHSTEEAEALVSLYVAGAMEHAEAGEFEGHLEQGCSTCAGMLEDFSGVADLLPYSCDPAEPSASVHDRLLSRVKTEEGSGDSVQPWKNWPAMGEQFFHLVRGDSPWEEVAIPGIRVRRLFADPQNDSVTMLVQMDAGTSYPSHEHGGPEQCFVLDGVLNMEGGVVLRAGDYQRADTGSAHLRQYTDTGCTLLIVSSLRDRIL